MRFFKYFHDKRSEKYARYYAIVLIVIIGFVLSMNLGIIHISPIEGTAIFFEGFASLYMLSRHEPTQKTFEKMIRFRNN